MSVDRIRRYQNCISVSHSVRVSSRLFHQRPALFADLSCRFPVVPHRRQNDVVENVQIFQQRRHTQTAERKKRIGPRSNNDMQGRRHMFQQEYHSLMIIIEHKYYPVIECRGLIYQDGEKTAGDRNSGPIPASAAPSFPEDPARSGAPM